LADLKIRSGAGHLSNKSARLDKALEALRAKRVRDLTPADAIALQAALVRAGLGNTTVNMRLGALQGMLRWAVRMRLIAESPIEQVQPLPQNERTLRRRRRALSEDEIQRLIAAAEAEDRQCAVRSVPQAAFFACALSTGLRYGELRLLAWGAVDFDNAMLHVRGEHAKSGKSRAIPLRRDLLLALAELARIQKRFLGREVVAADRVFLAPRGGPWLACSNNANRVLLRLLEAARIPRLDEAGRKIDLHALRHSFATRLARTGASMAHTQLLMGHSDVRLTARVYLHVEAENTRGAIDALPPTASEAVPSKLRLA
jgi:integrase/recombinase XerD